MFISNSLYIKKMKYKNKISKKGNCHKANRSTKTTFDDGSFIKDSSPSIIKKFKSKIVGF